MATNFLVNFLENRRIFLLIHIGTKKLSGECSFFSGKDFFAFFFRKYNLKGKSGDFPGNSPDFFFEKCVPFLVRNVLFFKKLHFFKCLSEFSGEFPGNSPENLRQKLAGKRSSPALKTLDRPQNSPENVGSCPQNTGQTQKTRQKI